MPGDKCVVCCHDKTSHRGVGGGLDPFSKRGPCDFQRRGGSPGCDCHKYQPSTVEIQREQDAKDLDKWPGDAIVLLRRSLQFLDKNDSIRKEIEEHIRKGERLGIDLHP